MWKWIDLAEIWQMDVEIRKDWIDPVKFLDKSL